MKLKDLTGMVFGRLTVVKHYGVNEKGVHTWLCSCECGNEAVVRGDALRHGSTKSCGCLAHESHVQLGKNSTGKPSPRFEDLTGRKYNFLTVLGRVKNNSHGSARWLCRCVCGRESIVVTAKLKNGRTISCGCMGLLHATQVKVRHNDARFRNCKRLYSVWSAMKRRCNNKNCVQYKYYGAKCVTVCEEWLTYTNFKAWALANGYSDNLTIDRIDSNGNYEPSNCQWVTLAENISRVKRLPEGVKQKAELLLRQGVSNAEIAKRLGISGVTVSRIKVGLGLAKTRKKINKQ